MVEIAVLVSGGGTNLQALIDAQKRKRLGQGRLALVVSSSAFAGALARAQGAGIPTAVVERKQFASRQRFTEAMLERLTQARVGLVVLAGFLYVLSPVFTRAFENRVINVHPALIPSFCGDGYYGLRVHQAALARGVKLTGATVHFVNEETDGGPIILQKSVAVLPEDTAEALQRRVMEQAEWEILPEAVRLFCDGCLTVEGSRVRIGTKKEGEAQ